MNIVQLKLKQIGTVFERERAPSIECTFGNLILSQSLLPSVTLIGYDKKPVSEEGDQNKHLRKCISLWPQPALTVCIVTAVNF